MPMPVERTRALRHAGEPLQELRKREDLPQDLRNRLKGVLRYDPEERQLHRMAQEWQRLGASAFGLTPEPA